MTFLNFLRNDFHKNHKMALSTVGRCSDTRKKNDNREWRQSSFTFLISLGRFCTSLPHRLYPLCVVWLWWGLGCEEGMVGNESRAASREAREGYNEIKSNRSLSENTDARTCHNARFKTQLCFHINAEDIQMWCSCCSSSNSNICWDEPYPKDANRSLCYSLLSI